MAVNQLKSQLQPSVRPARQTLAEHLLELRPPASPAQSTESLRVKIAAQLTQLLQQPRRRVVSQGDALHVHHRLSKTGLHQHVAPVVHVGELMAGRRPAQRLVHTAQFTSCVRAQTGKHHEPIDRQQTVPSGQQSLGIGRLMQGHVGPEHIQAAGFRRLKACRPRRPRQALQDLLPPWRAQGTSGVQRLAGFSFHDKTKCAGVTPAQFPVRCQPAPHRTPMRPKSGFELDPLQAIKHAARHLFMQPRRDRRRAALPARYSERIQSGRFLIRSHSGARGNRACGCRSRPATSILTSCFCVPCPLCSRLACPAGVLCAMGGRAGRFARHA